MPANLAPITPELLADFRGGKESALEQLFRANFDALTSEANERLEDIGTSQKVVAITFLEAWDKRAKLQTPDELEALLRHTLAGGITHEQRRRAAAHRFADTDGNHKEHEAKHATPAETIDQVWAKIAGELHTAKADPSERAKQIAEHRRHEAAAHMKAVAKPARSKAFAIGVIVVLAMVAIPLWYLNKGAESTKAGQLLVREDTHAYKSNPGQRGKVTLEDSTEVRLGAATTVKITASFPMDARALQVNGTAAFNAPVGKTPLLVKAAETWIYAAGSDFVVRSYPEDSGTVMIKATTGNLTVRNGNVEKPLAAGGTMQVLRNGTFMDLDADKAALAFDWVGGSFVSAHAPLRKVLFELKRWYGLEIAVKDTGILERPVSMTASLESSKDALAALETGGAVKVDYKGKVLTLVDNAAAVAKKKK